MELTLSIIGVVLGLIALMLMIYKGISGSLAAPIAAMIIALFSGLALSDTILVTFATGWANTVKSVCFIFVLSAAMAKVLTETGAAYTIAQWIADTFGVKRCIWAIYIGTYILQMSGFGLGAYLTMYPIGMVLCQKANYNKGIVVGTIITGGYVFGMTGPFAPGVQNAVCMKFFGTTPYGGLVPGLAVSIFMLLADCLYLNWQAKKWQTAGRGFLSQSEMQALEDKPAQTRRPNLFVSLIPVITVIVMFNVFGIELEVAMLSSIIVGVVVMWKQCDRAKWFEIINNGVAAGAQPLIGISIMAGFGAVVSVTPFYSWVTVILQNITIHPFIVVTMIGIFCGLALGSNVSAVILATTSLGSLMQGYMAAGYSAGNMHRLLIMSAGILDSLPHNGFMVALMASFNTTYKESYLPIFFGTVVIPAIGVICIGLPLAFLLG